MFSRNLCSYIALLLKDGLILMVCTWSFSHDYCKINLSTTHCCSNVSIDITESITLFIILDLIHLVAWSDFLSFIKKKYYLPTGVNLVGVLEFNILEGVEEIRCVWWLGVEMVDISKNNCVSQDCMSSLFVMVESFWIVFWEHKTEFFWYLSVIEGTDIVVNLIEVDVWYSEDELTGALIGEVESCDWLCL